MKDKTPIFRSTNGFFVSNKARAFENCCTFNSEFVQSELNLHINQHNLQAICIQEYRLLPKDSDPNIIIRDKGLRILFTVSAYFITNNATVGGVGITVRKQLFPLLTSTKKLTIESSWILSKATLKLFLCLVILFITSPH